MQLTPIGFVRKWADRFADNDNFIISARDLREFSVDINDTFGVTVANVPYYQAGTPYQKGFLVRYTPVGGQEAFYYSLQAGVLAAPSPGNLVEWKEMPRPPLPTELSQSLTLVQAQGLDRTGVVAGRAYLISCGPNPQGDIQVVTVRGVSNECFDVEGTLEVAGVRTAITDFNVQAGTWQTKRYGGSSNRSVYVTSQGLLTTDDTLFQELPVSLDVALIDNVAGLYGQVNYRDPTRDSIWVPGPVRNTVGRTAAALNAFLGQLLADMRAIPAAGLAIAGELMLRTTPIDTTLRSSFFLFGLGGGTHRGVSRNFRVAYSGPPIGNLLPAGPSQFQNTNDGFWRITGPGWATGGGQASTVGGNTTNDYLYADIALLAGNYTITVGVLSLAGPPLRLIFEAPFGKTVLDVFISQLGDNQFSVSVPSDTTARINLFGITDVALSHVYLLG